MPRSDLNKIQGRAERSFLLLGLDLIRLPLSLGAQKTKIIIHQRDHSSLGTTDDLMPLAELR